MEAASKKSEDQQVKKPAQQQIQSKGVEQSQAGFEASPLTGQSLGKLPEGPGTQGLRQAAVLQMQKTRGNAFVMRQMVQRDDEVPSVGPAEVPTEAPAESPSEESATPTQITNGGATVSTEGGVVNISGGMVNVDSALVTTSGVLRTSTLMADTVVASTYTPGAGNIM